MAAVNTVNFATAKQGLGPTSVQTIRDAMGKPVGTIVPRKRGPGVDHGYTIDPPPIANAFPGRDELRRGVFPLQTLTARADGQRSISVTEMRLPVAGQAYGYPLGDNFPVPPVNISIKNIKANPELIGAEAQFRIFSESDGAGGVRPRYDIEGGTMFDEIHLVIRRASIQLVDQGYNLSTPSQNSTMVDSWNRAVQASAASTLTQDSGNAPNINNMQLQTDAYMSGDFTGNATTFRNVCLKDANTVAMLSWDMHAAQVEQTAGFKEWPADTEYKLETNSANSTFATQELYVSIITVAGAETFLQAKSGNEHLDLQSYNQIARASTHTVTVQTLDPVRYPLLGSENLSGGYQTYPVNQLQILQRAGLPNSIGVPGLHAVFLPHLTFDISAKPLTQREHGNYLMSQFDNTLLYVHTA